MSVKDRYMSECNCKSSQCRVVESNNVRGWISRVKVEVECDEMGNLQFKERKAAMILIVSGTPDKQRS